MYSYYGTVIFKVESPSCTYFWIGKRYLNFIENVIFLSIELFYFIYIGFKRKKFEKRPFCEGMMFFLK
jgi:hypothetical protein